MYNITSEMLDIRIRVSFSSPLYPDSEFGSRRSKLMRIPIQIFRNILADRLVLFQCAACVLTALYRCGTTGKTLSMLPSSCRYFFPIEGRKWKRTAPFFRCFFLLLNPPPSPRSHHSTYIMLTASLLLSV
jgi:hypothetical protein